MLILEEIYKMATKKDYEQFLSYAGIAKQTKNKDDISKALDFGISKNVSSVKIRNAFN